MSSVQLLFYGFMTFYFILLNKFAASQTYICAIEDQEDKVTRITCPSGSIISDVRFASYGNPEGSCGSYTVGSCHAPNSMNIVANECLNQTTCSLTPSHAIFDFNECLDEALQLYAEALCIDFSTSPTVHSSGEELTVNVRDESTIEGMDTSASYIYPLATVTPTVCMTSNYGAISGSWIVCQVGATTAWISAATSSGGTYQADLICNYLGYSSVTAQGGTCGTVCGYCYNGGAGCGTTSTAGYYFSGGGGSVSSLSITVHWVCGNPISPGPTYDDDDDDDNNDDDDSSSSAIAIIIIIAIVVGCCVCCCGPTIFGIYFFFVLSRNNNRVVTVDSDTTDTSNNQEYGNGNIAHTFPVTKINQEYGNISPSFPVTSSNHGFPVATSVNNQGYGNISPSYPVTSSNHGFHVANSSTQGYGYGNITTSYTS